MLMKNIELSDVEYNVFVFVLLNFFWFLFGLMFKLLVIIMKIFLNLVILFLINLF